MSGSIQEVEQLQKKPRSERTYGESLQLFSFKLVKSLGFLGIMFAASVCCVLIVHLIYIFIYSLDP